MLLEEEKAKPKMMEPGAMTLALWETERAQLERERDTAQSEARILASDLKASKALARATEAEAVAQVRTWDEVRQRMEDEAEELEKAKTQLANQLQGVLAALLSI